MLRRAGADSSWVKPRTVVLLAALSAFGPLLATLAVGARPFTLSGTAHCVGVGVGAGFATLAAYAVVAVGVRRGDARTVLVGVAFASMGAILAVHGLVTPGILVENTNLSPITGGATVPVGAAVLALGTIPGFAVPARFRRCCARAWWSAVSYSRRASSASSTLPSCRPSRRPAARVRSRC